jgi:hypothetical protein
MMEITSLSYSKIAALLRCPRQFEYRYIKQSPAPLKGRMLAGRCYDHALNSAALKWQLFKELITPEEVADEFSTRWESELATKMSYDGEGEEKVEVPVVDFGDDDPGTLKDSGIKLAQMFVGQIMPTLDITYIQKRLEGQVEGIPFVGYPDVILDNGATVADHKFRQKKMSEKDVENDIQLPSYAMLMGAPVTGRFYQAIDAKEKKIEPAERAIGQGDIDWLRRLVVDAWQIIQNGTFPPNPLSWTCGPNCEYYMECRGSWF